MLPTRTATTRTARTNAEVGAAAAGLQPPPAPAELCVTASVSVRCLQAATRRVWAAWAAVPPAARSVPAATG